jgi:acetoin utilization deacetylase AcuC-like enzyme
VHHGNGTEEIFLADESVLTISLHQENLYPPASGGLDVRGAGGANVNVPLPAGTGDDGYAHALDAVLAPVLRRFAPELIILGAGQDASATDPLGRMSITVPGFRALTDRMVQLAGELCDGRLVAALEGGYSLQHVPLANLAILEGLAGLPPTFTLDPVGVDVPLALRDVERAAVDAAAEAHGV